MDLTSASDEQLVAAYGAAASDHLRATEQADHRRANKQHDVVAGVYRELQARNSREALLPLLASDDVGVRGWAAAHALEFSPTDGERVLSELSDSEGVGGFNAEMTLETWRNGDLRFP